MDKYEYNLKLEEIDKLVDQGDYEEAANLADTIEWKRVRNVRTLCLISEIYEAAGRLADSKQILERAYRKTPVGKSVLYRLVEVTTALQQYDEALEYYTEYVQAAPHDNNRYILKYKLYRGRGSSVEELITILEEYLGQEYTERWAYELAKLYRQAGQMQKCLAACDDLVLWFHSGKYVHKALDLKKKYAALTPKQQQIYEECMQEEAEIRLEQEEDGQSAIQESGQEPETEENVVVKIESTDGDVMAERIIAETEKSIAEEVTAQKAELEQQEPEIVQEAVPTQKIASGNQAPMPVGNKAAAGSKAAAVGSEAAAAGSKAAAAGSKAAAVGSEAAAAGSKAAAAGNKAVTVGREAAHAGNGNETVAAENVPLAAEPMNSEELQLNMARSMREIVSGVVKRPEVPEEDMPASVEARPRMTQKVEVPDTRIPTAGRLSIDDILLSMGDKGKQYAARMAQAEQEKIAEAEELQYAEMQRSQNETQNLADAEQDERTARTVKTVAEAAVEELTDAQREALQYTSNPEKLLRNKRSLPTYTEDSDDLGATRRAVSKEELMEAARQELLSEKTIRLPADQTAERSAQDSDRIAEARYSQKDYPQGGADGYRQDDYVQGEADGCGENDYVQNEADGYRQNDYAQSESDGCGESDYAQSEADGDGQNDYQQGTDAGYPEDGYPENDVPQASDEDEMYEDEEYEDEEYEDYLMIPDHLRNLFSGFTEIPELEDQIANAIIQAQSKGEDRTSKSGNILIFGAHGSGKTTMAMNLAKAIAQDRGRQVVKMAKIFAADLNKKDIASTVAKIAGGTLIIEEAGDLEDDTVEQLTTAMEFRTDGLIIILEDEQKYVHELLMRHPRFTMKFTAQIYIPEYTVEELAMFGQIYANEQDYMIGEEGMDAMYGKISALAEAKANDGELVAIKDVIDMVAKAIDRSNGFFRKMKMGKNRYDENDFIILFAKDFK